jgi:SAM-dependent methyltransferase
MRVASALTGVSRTYRHKARKRAKRARATRDRIWLRARSARPLWRAEQAVDDANTLFSTDVCRRVDGHVQRAVSRDEELLRRLSDSRIGGVRNWEYGILLGALRHFPERSGWAALDVGSGNSTFPRYLLETGNVGAMTTLDLDVSFERQSSANRERDERSGIKRVQGSMLDLPFPPASFDLVTCISAIEHLDGDPLAHRRDPENNRRAPYERYVADTSQALDSMMSVVRPGGFFYLTTDAFMPDRQTTDTWSNPDGSGEIWSAYRYEDVENVFVEAVRRNGFEFWSPPRFDAELLIDDPSRASYRGRHFTVFSLFVRRPEGR